MLTDAADTFRLGLWGDLAFIGDPAVVKEENEVHVQRAALVQLQRDQRQNEVSRSPPHRPPRNRDYRACSARTCQMPTRPLPAPLASTALGCSLYAYYLTHTSSTAVPSALSSVFTTHLIYSSTFCSILCLYRVTQMPAISFTVQCLFSCVKSAAHLVRWSARHRT